MSERQFIYVDIRKPARLFAVAGTGLMLLTTPAVAQFNFDTSHAVATPPRYQPIDEKGFGLTSANVKTIVAWNCQSVTSNMNAIEEGSVNALGFTLCEIDLPSGIQMTAFSLEACDNDPGAGVIGVITTCPSPDNTVSCSPKISTGPLPPEIANTGMLETPGCGFFDFDLPSSVTVDNTSNVYLAAFFDQGLSSDTNFRAMRITWSRQISPAPASATFNDVSTTHPFFQSIEAMAASGITGGCGGGNFCPDDPLSRAQMAAFLSRALGLHFPN